MAVTMEAHRWGFTVRPVSSRKMRRERTRYHGRARRWRPVCTAGASRSEEHTSELQSRFEIVCRLLLEKKKPPGAPTTWPTGIRGLPPSFLLSSPTFGLFLLRKARQRPLFPSQTSPFGALVYQIDCLGS